MNTVRQESTATVNRLRPHQDRMIPTMRARTPAIGLFVASVMAGNVITAQRYVRYVIEK